jgi:Phosphotransferase enzyme family
MLMTDEGVVAFLFEHGLVTERDLLDDHLTIEQVTGRNRNFRVVVGTEIGTKKGYFLKQTPEDDDGGRPLLTAESVIYEHSPADPAYSALAPFLPRFHMFDRARGVLVVDLEMDMGVAWDGDDVPPTTVAHAVADAVAACHSLPREAIDAYFPGRSAPARRPWVLTIARPNVTDLRELSPAQAQVIRIVQGRPNLEQQIDDLAATWVDTTFVHGDLKWSNILVRTGPIPEGRSAVTLVDWELAALGDPAWDVGSMLHSYLAYAVLGLPVDERATAEEATRLFANALPPVQAQLRAFWSRYVMATMGSEQDVARLLKRVVPYTGARLLQSAFEWCHGEAHVPRSATAVLQIGINILGHPDAARHNLLGLT